MTAMEPAGVSADPEDRIAVIAGVILDAYGDDAELVARRQLDAADHQSRADWIAILDRLQRR